MWLCSLSQLCLHQTNKTKSKAHFGDIIKIVVDHCGLLRLQATDYRQLHTNITGGLHHSNTFVNLPCFHCGQPRSRYFCFLSRAAINFRTSYLLRVVCSLWPTETRLQEFYPTCWDNGVCGTRKERRKREKEINKRERERERWKEFGQAIKEERMGKNRKWRGKWEGLEKCKSSGRRFLWSLLFFFSFCLWAWYSVFSFVYFFSYFLLYVSFFSFFSLCFILFLYFLSLFFLYVLAFFFLLFSLFFLYASFSFYGLLFSFFFHCALFFS